MIINKEIKSDFYRINGQTGTAKLLRMIFKYKNFRYIFMFRILKVYNKQSLIGFFANIIYRRLTFKLGFQIPISVIIGEGFRINHFGHVVINSKVQIGKNCTLHPGVIIGASARGKSKGVPKLEDSIWVGANAVLVGNITIGSNTLIAPNSYVNINIPPDSIVFGNPCTIKYSSEATTGYLLNKI